MRRTQLLLMIGILTAGGCDASFPTPPAPTPLVGLQLFFETTAEPIVGTVFSVTAVAVDSDRAYRDVGSETTFTVSNPSVAVMASSGRSVFTIAPGAVELVGIYEGFTASIPIVIRPRPGPDTLSLIPRPGPDQVGETTTHTAIFFSGSNARNVTSLAVWTSSNPAVATAQSGRITAVGIGHTEIGISYEGVFHSYWISVQPRRF